LRRAVLSSSDDLGVSLTWAASGCCHLAYHKAYSYSGEAMLVYYGRKSICEQFVDKVHGF